MKKTEKQRVQQAKLLNALINGEIKAWEYGKAINKLFKKNILETVKPVKKKSCLNCKRLKNGRMAG